MSLLLKSDPELSDWVFYVFNIKLSHSKREEIMTELNIHVKMANSIRSDSVYIPLSQSQHAHVKMAAKLIIYLNLSLPEIEKCVKVESIPAILLAIDPKNSPKTHHPFLLFSRYHIRSVNKSCLPSANDLTDMVEFVQSALQALLSLSPTNSTDLMHKSTCAQMAMEIGKYYFVMDNYEKTIEYFSISKVLLEEFELTDDNIWIDFTIAEVERIFNICQNIVKSKSTAPENQSNELSIITLITANWFFKKDYANEPIFNMFLEDIFNQEMPVVMKKLFSLDALKAGFNDQSQLITFCLILIETIKKNDKEAVDNDQMEVDYEDYEYQMELESATHRLERLSVENIYKQSCTILNPDFNVILKLITVLKFVTSHNSFPSTSKIYNDWLVDFQFYIFSFLMQLPTGAQVIQKDEFWSPLFDKYPYFRPINNLLECPLDRPGQAASPMEMHVALYEMILTKITPQEEKYITDLTPIINKHPVPLCSRLLNQAEELYERQSYSACLDLARMVEQNLGQVPQSQNLKDRVVKLQTAAVISQVVDQINLLDIKTQRDQIPLAVRQVYDTLHAATPNTLKLFKRVVVTMLEKNQSATALMYTQEIQNSKLSDPNLLADMFNLGRIIILISALSKSLVDNGLSLDASLDANRLCELPVLLIGEIVSFSIQIGTWLTECDISKSPNQVHVELVDYLTTLPKGIWSLILGCIGGVAARSMQSICHISIEALGPFCVFSFPGSWEWSKLGVESLAQKIDPNQFPAASLSIEDAKKVVGFLQLCCDAIINIDKNAVKNIYFLKALLHKCQLDHKQAVISTLDGILMMTEYLHESTLLSQFFTGPFLNPLIHSLIELKCGLDAVFLMQCGSTVDYDLAFNLLRSVTLSEFLGEETEMFIDPPQIHVNLSPIYGFWDLHILEYIMNLVSPHPKYIGIVNLMKKRLAQPHFMETAPHFGLYVERLQVWYLTCMIERHGQPS
ncbi:hypothetical protein BC833DRAFT_602638 [Globomyces pollinis-pini]|nr:hypothetical protein BC833DRAFT_602638 [Globomyces pollinis-pini]